MELDIVLFLAGSAMAVAALGIIVYRGIPDLKVSKVEPVPKTTETPAPEVELESEPQPIAEAPDPFSDDGGFSSSKKVTVPTDTTVLNPSSPLLVVPLPKSVRRARSKTTRKKRVSKLDSVPTITGSPIQTIENQMTDASEPKPPFTESSPQ